MIVFLLILAGILLVLVQTCVPAATTILYGCDLLLPFILYVSVYSSFRFSLGLAIGLGVLMDSMTGGSFGIYLTMYAWLVVFSFWFQKVMPSSRLGWVLICAIAMVLETILLWLVFAVKSHVSMPVFELHQFLIPFMAMFVIAPISFVLYSRIRISYQHHFFIGARSADTKRRI